MLSTLHSCSGFGTKNDLQLFSITPTQFSHEASHMQTFLPLSASFQKNETLEFRVRNISGYFIDIAAVFLRLKGRVLRSTGELITSQDKDKSKADSVWPIDSFASSLFESCEVFLNDKCITFGDHYAYRSFFDMLMNATVATRYTGWPMCYSNDTPGREFNRTDTTGIGLRYKTIEDSREFELASPIFSDICQQGKLLLPGVDVRFTFKQTENKFRLMTADSENRQYKVELLTASLEVKFVRISPSVCAWIENKLNPTDKKQKRKKALYMLRGLGTRHRTILAGSQDIVLEDLALRTVPSRLTLAFIKNKSFHGDFKLNPYQMENLQMEKSSLSVGSRVIEQDYNFDKGQTAFAFMNLIRHMNNPLTTFSKEVYEKQHFFISYILTPDSDMKNLSPVTSENIRFTAKLRKPLEDSVTCLIVLESPRVVEIDADRNIEIIHPQARDE